MFAKKMPRNSPNVQSQKDVPTLSVKEDQQMSAVQGNVTNTALLFFSMLLLQTCIHPFLIGNYLFSREGFV